jgi:DNA repair photolyase
MSNNGVFGTYEWAVKNANFITGCYHNCKYCYSREMSIRFKRKNSKNWKIEEINSTLFAKKHKKVIGTIMFPSSHDITPNNIEYSLRFIQRLLEPGNNVLIVTKPHLSIIKSICDSFNIYRDNILFRFTIGSMDSSTLKFWEPNAPSFEERYESLKYAFNRGFKTSVSCEPILDQTITDLVTTLEPYITDSIWIGKMNFLLRRLKMNGINDSETMSRAQQLIEFQNDTNITQLFLALKGNLKIKWKESIKKVVKLELASEKGLDI